MIKVSGKPINVDNLNTYFSDNSIQLKIANTLSSSNETYTYSSLEQLLFELNLRASTVNSALKLSRSNMDFASFRKSRCNPDFWNRNDDGSFSLKDGVKPSEAIRDIFNQGRKYGTECATAMVIVFYGAILDIYKDELFDKTYPKITLNGWDDLDKNLGLRDYEEISDVLPGDCKYIKNPDVSPLTPEWQGENVLYIGNNLYFGHGIGNKTEAEMIKLLNLRRKSGSTESAYMTNPNIHQDFKYLEKKMN